MLIRNLIFAVLAIFIVWRPGLSIAEDNPTLIFFRSGKKVTQLNLRQMREKIMATTERFFDPRYGKEKTYNCLPIKEVMKLAFGSRWVKFEQTEAVLTALDGYASVSSADKLDEDHGCLAFADAEVPGWELVGRKRVNPGPFYLTWTKPEQSTEHEYPWPYQLVAINLVKFEERYPAVVPKGVKKDTPAYRGYLLFRGRCMRCHAINQQGGRIGPDLNAPRSIVTYRDKNTLLQFIRQPSKFRYSEMPDHTDLTNQNLEDIYQYFLIKSNQKENPDF